MQLLDIELKLVETLEKQGELSGLKQVLHMRKLIQQEGQPAQWTGWTPVPVVLPD